MRPLRSDILERLRDKLMAGQPIRTAIARINDGKLSIADSDLSFLYHTSRLKEGSDIGGLLPLVDSNEIVLELGNQISDSNQTLIAGICATDPFRTLPNLIDRIKELPFIGVQNFPTLGMMDGHFRQRLAQSQISFAQEIEMIGLAHAAGLLTISLVFNSEEAAQMAEAGADIIVIHPGAKAFRKSFDLNDFAKHADKIARDLKNQRSDLLLVRYNGATELVRA